MASAALEQYLIYGTSGADALRAAFAYGFNLDLSDPGNEESNEDLEITNMFWSGNGKDEIEGWEQIRREHLQVVSMKS